MVIRTGQLIIAAAILILTQLCISILAQGGDEMSPREHYFVKLIGTRPGWPENMSDEESRIMDEHFIYLKDLVAQKKVIAAGPVMEPTFGMIILQVNSKEEALEIMKNEPSIVQGVHAYEMQPMTLSLLVENISPDKFVANPTDRIIHREAIVPARIDEVWHAWTTTEGVSSFFSSNAKVELRVGGAFEIYFDMNANPGFRGSEGCIILSYLPKKMLSFSWNAPPSLGEMRNRRTHAVLLFDELEHGSTKVTFEHIGWGEGSEWNEVYNYFDKAWTYVFSNFEKSFAEKQD